MSTLAEIPELVGFFSYSREDDEAFRGALSALRDGIYRELSAQLGRTKRTFRLFQDQVATRRCQASSSALPRIWRVSGLNVVDCSLTWIISALRAAVRRRGRESIRVRNAFLGLYLSRSGRLRVSSDLLT
jgi:hypothetical protein